MEEMLINPRRRHLVFRIIGLGILSPLAVSFGRGAEPQSAKVTSPCDEKGPDVSDVNAQVGMRIQKETGENLALLVIGQYKPESAEFKQARELYDTTSIAYNAYTKQALFNMVKQQKGDLSPSAKNACEAAKKFEAFVKEKTKARDLAGGLVVAATLVEFGFKLVDMFKKRKEAQRQSIADGLMKEVIWKSWNELLKTVSNS